MPSHMTEKSLDRAGKPEKRKKKRPPEEISADANPPPTKKKKKKEAGDPTKIQEPKEKKRKKLDQTAAAVISGADKPRAKKRAVKEEPAAAVASASSADEEAPADGGARVACTLFVGQLPYKATAKDVEAHFLAVCAPPVSVRLLTERESGASRGMAFVELSSESEVHSALRLHHSCLYGRRINVERTVGGGSACEKRQSRIGLLREKQGAQMSRKVRELVEEALPAACEAEEGQVTREDFDERAVEFLLSVSPPVAEAAIAEMAGLNLSGVRNRSAWLMGVLRRFVAESDPFGKSKEQEEATGDGEGGGQKGKG
eukprot:CAMPEP_0196673812 /NCGR_PEP_ID=MMETSP1090-20130531/3159_1 /TAXON_ID=37098 /ORGANISM="Isochrysis sp, Strain CCMP1244" /LENGTH=314 /DNA_ID=CAMNT_0042011589 /DNA_START=54 /DNA_END=995 /DNA_ORIENTATION=+